MKSIRIVTYNIHKGRGLDRRLQIGRIAEVLREIGGDVVALQEVLSIEGKEPEDHQAHFLAKELGLHYRIGETRQLRGGVYGNVTLSRYSVLHSRQYDITQAGREERGCLRTDIEVSRNSVLHIYNLHLGTSYKERRYQALKLFDSEILKTGGPKDARIILGDFNEWFSGLASVLFRSRFSSVPVRPLLWNSRTYPGLFPIVHLDRIYFDGPDLHVDNVVVHRSRKALVASDHLPIVADFRLRGD